jgi:hypothetical protein
VKLFDNHTYPTHQIYNYVSHASPVSEPGVRYSYSNLGIGLLGHVLSLKAGSRTIFASSFLHVIMTKSQLEEIAVTTSAKRVI